MTGSEYITLIKESPQKGHRLLFDEYCNYVYTIVYNKLRSCASREDMEECVSDIFVAVYLNCDGGGFSGDLKGYIGTVAKRKAIDSYRRLTARELQTVSIEEESVNTIKSEYNIEEEAEKSELQNILLNKIEELGEPDSTIVIQRYYYNRTSKEIAVILSMKASAVRMRLRRALSRLRTSLAEVGITLYEE